MFTNVVLQQFTNKLSRSSKQNPSKVIKRDVSNCYRFSVNISAKVGVCSQYEMAYFSKNNWKSQFLINCNEKYLSESEKRLIIKRKIEHVFQIFIPSEGVNARFRRLPFINISKPFV